VFARRQFSSWRGLDDAVNEKQNKYGTIAIVDDDAPLREALGSVMKAAGLAIETFGSAEDFLAAGNRERIACLVLDVRLPGMSGLELQKLLRERASPLPIVFVTGHGDAALRDLALKAGAADFLNKPVRSETLLKAIHAAVEQENGNQRG
jgi:FixJ family two-component response regulator